MKNQSNKKKNKMDAPENSGHPSTSAPPKKTISERLLEWKKSYLEASRALDEAKRWDNFGKIAGECASDPEERLMGALIGLARSGTCASEAKIWLDHAFQQQPEINSIEQRSIQREVISHVRKIERSLKKTNLLLTRINKETAICEQRCLAFGVKGKLMIEEAKTLKPIASCKTRTLFPLLRDQMAILRECSGFPIVKCVLEKNERGQLSITVVVERKEAQVRATADGLYVSCVDQWTSIPWWLGTSHNLFETILEGLGIA